ncbi:Long-chain-fatty-acid--CoA ligase [Candidatus Terasakiella magnetica]|uniref:Long-chain-fatty-acid--CoA ligase n=1 Tax=Candidatus Terasakiella magnetica TaxID=1867952 RepID=A0A1C3RBY0_9PROT|nr:long-chain fatty acid--CoA ligase [Candidatus Terasakiella magnetica]SCA54758.1 Long-chain-fatty-acid--CoA ligase [Candidatus Terasakiella magnetica]
MTKSVIDYFDQAVERFADRPCVDFLDKKYTYGEIAELVDRAAKGFQQLGVKKGSKVGICLPNTPYFVVCYYAILKVGGTVVNYNPLYVERELAYQIEDSQTEIMITLDLKQIFPKVEKCLETTCLQRIIVCSMSEVLPSVKSVLFNVLKRSELVDFNRDPAHLSFTRLANTDGAYNAVKTLDEDLAVLQYTGGTTGRPKGAMLTHANIAANTHQVRHAMPPIVEGEECMLGVLPFFHVFAMTVVMNLGISIGAELVLLPRFELQQLLKTLSKKQATLVPGVPTIYTAINGASDLAKYDLSSIKFCISGGAPLPVEVKSDFERLTGCTVVEGYGLTEASPVATVNPPTGEIKAGSIGLPLIDTKVSIRNPDNPKIEMAQGEKGEIVIEGSQVMAGYWQRPEATENTVIDGRLHTGDIGYMDEEGYIFIVDRIKDLILCSGYNVYPREIEEAIYLHERVAECIVIGIEDEHRGQAPKAFVKLVEGEEGLTADELKAFLKDKLSRIEMPKEIEMRDELPKTMVGKLSKKELVEEERAKKTA